MQGTFTGRIAPLSHTQAPQSSSWLARTTRYIHLQCVSVRPRAHASYRGVYSIERLCAYGEYCRQASFPRVLTACLLTPLPALTVVLAVECIPLSAPSLGWQANFVVFVRVFICAIAVASSLLLQAKNIIPDLKLTLREASVIATSTATAYTVVLLLLASLWVFPIPFIIVVGSAPFVGFTAISIVVTVGVARIRQVAHQRQRFVAFLKLAAIQASMTAIYPTFQAIFIQLDSAIGQIVAICALQIIKWVLKRLLATQIANGIDDYKPEVIVFSVDVFRGLYISSCMQTANSPWTKFVIIAIDIFHQALALNQIHHRTAAIQQHLTQRAPNGQRQDLVAIVVQLLQDPEKLESGSLQRIRVASILIHPIPPQVLAALQKFRSVHFATETLLTRAVPNSILPKRLEFVTTASVSVDPSHPPATAVSSRDGKLVNDDTTATIARLERRAQLLQQTLELLYTCEYLALAEYVECMVPMAYAVYLVAMKALPNAQYYPQLAAMDTQSLSLGVYTILLYAAVELMSFIVFHRLVRRRLGVSPLHQLAFVLENQIEMVEGKLIAWVLIVLQFPLVHFGADFSFRFSWIPR